MGSGDPMFGLNLRLAALSASAMSVFVLAGCGASNGVDTAPPSAVNGAAAETAPELMGAPPAPDAAAAPDGLLGASTAEPAAMAVAPPPPTNPNLKTWRRPDGTLVTAMRPIANPKVRHAARYAPRASTVAASHAVVAAPVGKPMVVAAAPVLKPIAPPKPVALAAKPMSKIDMLQAAVAPEATKGAVLAAGDSLGKGAAGQVTLSLPATLGDMIKAQAAKLGLGKAAKKTSAYAKLEGEGYEVSPNGKQTAVIEPGKPTTFAWQVKPGPQAKGQLKSEFGIDLNGLKAPQSFSLGEIMKRVAPLPEQVKAKTGGWLAKLNLPALKGDVNLPGLGATPTKSVFGGALVLLAVIILAVISRNAMASRAQAERRRKFRTLTDYGRNEMEHDDAPTTAHVSHVSPMVAAAAAGAVAATAVSHGHDDHGHDAHGHDNHGHDDHGHAADDHGHDGHDAHAHDDHGHAGDLHADAHPEAHAPAEHVAYVNPMVAATHAPVSHAPAHDDHGHDDHGHKDEHGHDDHGHGEHAADGHDAHAHDDHKHDDHHAAEHGHDDHHAKEPEHAH